MIGICFIAAGVLCLLVFILPLPGIVFNAGSALGIALGAVLILYGAFRKRLPRRLHKVLYVLAALIFAVLLVFGGLLTGAAKQRPADGHAVTLLILGCRVNGSVPSLMLRNRIGTAARYLEEHPEVKAVCSGGQGDDEDTAEAKCIYNELVRAGIDPNRLYIEDASSSTKENIAFSKQLIEREGLPRDVILVTNDYHCYRAMKLAQRAGLTAFTFPAKTAAYLLPTYFLRECCGILYMWLCG